MWNSGRLATFSLELLINLTALDFSGETHLVVALDISKAFDNVWHKGLLCNLQSYGVSGGMLSIISAFQVSNQ